MAISKNDILSEVILDNYKLLKIIDRFGIKLGLGNKTIESICVEQGVNKSLLCLLMNLFCDQTYSIHASDQYDYIPLLVDYLEKSHEYFLQNKIPKIQTEISKLVYNIPNPKSSLIKVFFDNYITEVNEHMDHENKIVFNYVLNLYKAYEDGKQNKTDSFSILVYETDHEDIEQVLMDLKHLLLKHLPQKDGDDNRVKVLTYLFELEHEMQNHQRIENELLIPLVKGLESQVQKNGIHAK